MIQEDNQDFTLKKDKNTSNDQPISKEVRGRIWVGVEDKIINHYQRKNRHKSFLKVACTILFLGIVGYWYTNFTSKSDENLVATSQILPGTDKAILTLEDGRQIDLNSTNLNDLEKHGVELITQEDGQLVYKINSNDERNVNGFNTITTPRGGQYRIILPDDSEVLLNASSSLRFAKNIETQKLREVELTGEGFFKVRKSKEKPFIVYTSGQEVRVLGTVFNVNAYNQTGVMTTLLEGSVEINKQKIIKPGQQGISVHSAEAPIIKTVEVEDYVDWVNKQFIFRDEKISDIMERLSRWYDFDVLYAKSVDKTVTFNGELSRYASVNDVLKFLSKTSSLRFEITNKTITVK